MTFKEAMKQLRKVGTAHATGDMRSNTASDSATIRNAMSILGKRTSEAKKRASRQNGKLGGRPAKSRVSESAVKG